MEEKEAKKRILNKIIDGAPKSLWIVLAYICLIPLCLSLSLNMAHIRVDDYVNGLLKLELIRAEATIESHHDVKSLKDKINLLEEEINKLKLLSHEPGGQDG